MFKVELELEKNYSLSILDESTRIGTWLASMTNSENLDATWKHPYLCLRCYKTIIHM